MRRRLPCLVLLSAVIVVTALYHAGNVLGTPSKGFTSTPIAKGRFGEVDVFSQLVNPPDVGQEGNKGNVWLSLQKTKGLSDLYVQRNTWQPVNLLTGEIASTGWHAHPGHSLIIVKAGTVTAYEGNDPDCKPTRYT